MAFQEFASVLSERANVVRRDVEIGDREQPIFVYEDHRYLVFALWLARHHGVFSEPITLVWHDKHDDCRPLIPAVRTRARELAGTADPRDVLTFVEWELASRDDDWVHALFEMNLVGDAVLIGATVDGNLTDPPTPYVDLAGRSHVVRQLPFLWDALTPRGDLVDLAVPSLRPLWNSIGWGNHNHVWGFTPPGGSVPMTVVDFDLDCFTAEVMGETIPLPDDIFFPRWETTDHRTSGLYQSPKQFLRELCARSLPFITIARESPYCGGIRNSQIILEQVGAILAG